jgi:hypothetical protein
MKAKFAEAMQLKSDGRRLEACGDLDWKNKEPDGLQAQKVIVNAKITQGNVIAQGRTHECDDSIAEWMVDLKPPHGQKFQEGAAHFDGVLVAIDPQSNQTFEWDGDLTLTFNAVDDGG